MWNPLTFWTPNMGKIFFLKVFPQYFENFISQREPKKQFIYCREMTLFCYSHPMSRDQLRKPEKAEFGEK